MPMTMTAAGRTIRLHNSAIARTAGVAPGRPGINWLIRSRSWLAGAAVVALALIALSFGKAALVLSGGADAYAAGLAAMADGSPFDMLGARLMTLDPMTTGLIALFG